MIAQLDLFSNDTQLTLFANEAWEDSDALCAHCQVIAIAPGEEYCLGCAQEICDYLYANNLD